MDSGLAVALNKFGVDERIKVFLTQSVGYPRGLVRNIFRELRGGE